MARKQGLTTTGTSPVVVNNLLGWRILSWDHAIQRGTGATPKPRVHAVGRSPGQVPGDFGPAMTLERVCRYGCKRHAAFAFIGGICVHLRYDLLQRARCRLRINKGVDAGPEPVLGPALGRTRGPGMTWNGRRELEWTARRGGSGRRITPPPGLPRCRRVSPASDSSPHRTARAPSPRSRRPSPCGRAGTAWHSPAPGRSAGCHS